MKLFHGTKFYHQQDRMNVAEFPRALPAQNGHGFYLTDNREIAAEYGYVIEYEVPDSWVCELMRPITIHNLKGLEYVLSQHEADALVVDHALSITIH